MEEPSHIHEESWKKFILIQVQQALDRIIDGSPNSNWQSVVKEGQWEILSGKDYIFFHKPAEWVKNRFGFNRRASVGIPGFTEEKPANETA